MQRAQVKLAVYINRLGVNFPLLFNIAFLQNYRKLILIDLPIAVKTIGGNLTHIFWLKYKDIFHYETPEIHKIPTCIL